jgi:hypothetical protein
VQPQLRNAAPSLATFRPIDMKTGIHDQTS